MLSKHMTRHSDELLAICNQKMHLSLSSPTIAWPEFPFFFSAWKHDLEMCAQTAVLFRVH